MKRKLLHLFIHAGATVAFIGLAFIAFYFHEEVRGRPPARGVSLGLSMELIMVAHLLLNLVMAVVPRLSLKLMGVVVFAATTFHFLLPQHPLRASFLAGSGALCCVLAIVLCRHVPRQARAATEDTGSPSEKVPLLR